MSQGHEENSNDAYKQEAQEVGEQELVEAISSADEGLRDIDNAIIDKILPAIAYTDAVMIAMRETKVKPFWEMLKENGLRMDYESAKGPSYGKPKPG